MNAIEEIKSRVNISDLLARLGIAVDKRGYTYSIYNKGERSPSLKVNPNKNSYRCFSAGVGGDVIRFYCDYFGVSVATAIKELKEMFSIGTVGNHKETVQRIEAPIKTIPAAKYELLTESEKETFEERAAIIEHEGKLDKIDAEKLAMEFIIKLRDETRSNIYEAMFNYCVKDFNLKTLNYLLSDKRKLHSDSIERFRLFGIKSVSNTISFLKDNFNEDELKISGLFSNKGFFIPSFHRVAIPYLKNGLITYLRFRYFDKQGNDVPLGNFGKYIGVSGLSSRRLFNEDVLKTLPYNSDIFICEGEFDTIKLSEINCNAVGVAGVGNFPNNAVQLLSSYNIFLVFDNDTAGEKGVADVSGLFNKPVKQVLIKNFKDVTELLK